MFVIMLMCSDWQRRVRPLFPDTLRRRLKNVTIRDDLFRELMGHAAFDALPHHSHGYMRHFLAEEFSESDAIHLRIATSELVSNVVVYEFAGTLEEFYDAGVLGGLVSVPKAKLLRRHSTLLTKRMKRVI